ncbi:hypothetical protein BAUCODRAFT_298885 [Baudoinia panamericana UAMH 10762]|uniref:Uncharacterized protein n=1 Tax=Baudoinia panamericana (strain UAMH 10762) TaxID=717646 RepID=M2LCD1_BAUPA|nr:uncharacterized protein BAUCODRAFT_298885 [Baudoinia panamericana UAMH 10762]EMC91602.1 hypothetical protein BAUCODRAFT_298885 [Baudoinia panamericana UAMH 10762]
MVLENATADDAHLSPEPFVSNDPQYASGSDFDEGRTPETTIIPGRIRIDQRDAPPIFLKYKSLPQSLVGRYSPERLGNTLSKSCQEMANRIHRPLREDEIAAQSFYILQASRTSSYGLPIGFAFGVAQAYRTRKEYRFPLWSPLKEGSWFNKDVFLFFRGFQARVLWQAARFSAYSTVGMAIGAIFFSSYGATVAAVGFLRDPRLKDMNEILAAQRKAREARTPNRQEEAPGARQGWETHDMARQRRSVQDLERRGRQHVEDASPTGGVFSEENMYPAEQQGFMSEQEVQHEADARVQRAKERADASATAAGRTTNDDTSQSSRASRESQTKQSGSAWDRLRREAASGQANVSTIGSLPSESAGARSSARGSESSSLGDSFSFSSSDAERQLAKSEAQKSFDARLAREREGKDFDDTGARGWK